MGTSLAIIVPGVVSVLVAALGILSARSTARSTAQATADAERQKVTDRALWELFVDLAEHYGRLMSKFDADWTLSDDDHRLRARAMIAAPPEVLAPLGMVDTALVKLRTRVLSISDPEMGFEEVRELLSDDAQWAQYAEDLSASFEVLTAALREHRPATMA